jgi:hypothetical protein
MTDKERIAQKLDDVHSEGGKKLVLRAGDAVTFHVNHGTVSLHREGRRLWWGKKPSQDDKALLFHGGSPESATRCRATMEEILPYNLVHDVEASGPGYEIWRLTDRA